MQLLFRKSFHSMCTCIFMCIYVCVLSTANALDFHYDFMTVVSPNADQYLIGQSNMQKMQETMWPELYRVKYWGPTLSTGRGELIYLFPFTGLSESIFLKFSILGHNFGSLYGSGSAWASTDGINYSLLADCQPSHLLYFEQFVDSRFLGSSQFYLKIILDNYNSPTTGYTMAQFCRTDLGAPQWDPPFSISETNLTVLPESKTWVISLIFLVIISNCRLINRLAFFDYTSIKCQTFKQCILLALKSSPASSD